MVARTAVYIVLDCTHYSETLYSAGMGQGTGAAGCLAAFPTTSCEKAKAGTHSTRRLSRDAGVINATLPADIRRADYDDGELEKVVPVVILGSRLVPVQLVLGVFRASLV